VALAKAGSVSGKKKGGTRECMLSAVKTLFMAKRQTVKVLNR
jgi:hypothetical protein